MSNKSLINDLKVIAMWLKLFKLGLKVFITTLYILSFTIKAVEIAPKPTLYALKL